VNDPDAINPGDDEIDPDVTDPATEINDPEVNVPDPDNPSKISNPDAGI